MNDDSELRHYVEAKAARMHSRAMYRRLKATVDGWAREERVKSRLALLSLAWLAGLALSALFLGWLGGVPLLASLFGGFVVWVALVLALMRKLLGRAAER